MLDPASDGGDDFRSINDPFVTSDRGPVLRTPLSGGAKGGLKDEPSEPLQIFQATVYFFRGDLVIDRSNTSIPIVRCRLAASVSIFSISQIRSREPIIGSPLPHNRRCNQSKSCRVAYTSAYRMRKAKNSGQGEWEHGGMYIYVP